MRNKILCLYFCEGLISVRVMLGKTGTQKSSAFHKNDTLLLDINKNISSYGIRKTRSETVGVYDEIIFTTSATF